MPIDKFYLAVISFYELSHATYRFLYLYLFHKKIEYMANIWNELKNKNHNDI